MGEDSCYSQTTKEGSKSILLVTTLWSLFAPQTKHWNNATSRKVEKYNHPSTHFGAVVLSFMLQANTVVVQEPRAMSQTAA